MALTACSLIVDDKLQQRGADASVPADAPRIPDTSEPPPPLAVHVRVLEPPLIAGQSVPIAVPGDLVVIDVDVTVERTGSSVEPKQEGLPVDVMIGLTIWRGEESLGVISRAPLQPEGEPEFSFTLGEQEVPPPGEYKIVAELLRGNGQPVAFASKGEAWLIICSDTPSPLQPPECSLVVPPICAPQEADCTDPCTAIREMKIECRTCHEKRRCPSADAQPCVFFQAIEPVLAAPGMEINVALVFSDFSFRLSPEDVPSSTLKVDLEFSGGAPMATLFDGIPEIPVEGLAFVLLRVPGHTTAGLYDLHANLMDREKNEIVAEACWPILIGGREPGGPPPSQ